MAEGLIEGRLASRIHQALTHASRVQLNGPRQTAKATVASRFASRAFQMLSLDDDATLTAQITAVAPLPCRPGSLP